MDEIERKARELLAAEYMKQGLNNHADMIGNSRIPNPVDAFAIRAIIAALTPPEGYVLVPVELLRIVIGCAYPVSTEIDPRGYRWSEAYLDQALPHVKAALLAARPEVKGD